MRVCCHEAKALVVREVDLIVRGLMSSMSGYRRRVRYRTPWAISVAMWDTAEANPHWEGTLSFTWNRYSYARVRERSLNYNYQENEKTTCMSHFAHSVSCSINEVLTWQPELTRVNGQLTATSKLEVEAQFIKIVDKAIYGKRLLKTPQN